MASVQPTVLRAVILQWICILLIFVYEAAPQQQATTIRTETKTYEYEYDIGSQYHNESKGPNGVVKGEYGHWSPDGWFRITNYTADKDGYRVNRRRLRARKGQFGNGIQPGSPPYNNKSPQGGAVYTPAGSGNTGGSPGVYTPRTPYSPPAFGVGVNGVGGAHGLGDRPGDRRPYADGSTGSTPPDSGLHTAESRPVEFQGGVPPLGFYPSQQAPEGTLTGRQPWTTGPGKTTASPYGTGYPIAAQTPKSSGIGPINTVYPGLGQTTPPSQRFKYPPASPPQFGVHGGQPGTGGTGGGFSNKPFEHGTGGAGRPYGSGVFGTDDTSGPYGTSGLGDGVSPKTSGPYGTSGQGDGVSPKTSGPYGTIGQGGGVSQTSGPYGTIGQGGGVSPTSGTRNPYKYGGPGDGSQGGVTPSTSGIHRPYMPTVQPQPNNFGGPYLQGGPGTGGSGGPPSAGGSNVGLSPGPDAAKWPYATTTATRYPGNGYAPMYPPVRSGKDDGQTSDRSCRPEPGHSFVPVGFPDNLQPLGVARDDHTTADGKMLGKYTMTFPFGYVMEISYSAYQDPALAAKYLPQQTHNQQC